MVSDIETIANSYDGVIGIHDLAVHNYGPGKVFASLHVEVDAAVDVMLSHDMIDNIEHDIAKKLGINCTVHMDPIDLSDPNREPLKHVLMETVGRHLRNHAFILEKKGWTLSPLYDVNPVPYGDELALNVNEDDNRISVPLALDAAVSFGIRKEEAQNFSAEILRIVRDNWETLAKHYNISRGQIDDMRPAFSACY